MLKPAPTKDNTGWFVQDRFGMFVHWGLYALPARHEWSIAESAGDTLTLELPVQKPNVVVPVIELFLKG